MERLDGWRSVRTLVLFVFLVATNVLGQVFSSLVGFDGTDGGNPSASLVQGIDGNFYGTTRQSANCIGSAGCGTIFKITPGGLLTTLHVFSGKDGEVPGSGLDLGTDGSVYGTTNYGGAHHAGVVYKLSPAGAFTRLYSFCSQPKCADGKGPSKLTQSIDGRFYGTTFQGGPGNFGTVFKITSRGNFSTIHNFTSTEGGGPSSAGLIQGRDGNFYGVTSVGVGTVFKVTPNGTLTTLHRFCSKPGCTDGTVPVGALAQGADGNFFGTTLQGGDAGRGTIFRITATGRLTTIYNFCQLTACADGAGPNGILQATDGHFYGTTQGGGDPTCDVAGCGTIFQLAEAGTVTTLHVFEYSDGSIPIGTLLQSTNGSFYGLTFSGGDPACIPWSGAGCGTAFSLGMVLNPFVTFVLGAGRVGQVLGILGQGFTGTSTVTINGVLTQFTVESDTFLIGTVPSGATTGCVEVTTPRGTLTSNVPFLVIK